MLADNTAKLSVGNNKFTVKVTAENGEYKTYTVTIKRKEKLSDVISNYKSGYYVFGAKLYLTLSHSNRNAKIYYTLDGTVPNSDSNLYKGKIEISDVTEVKAIAVYNGYDDSDVLEISFKKAAAPTNLKIQSISSDIAELRYSVPEGIVKYSVAYSSDRGKNWYNSDYLYGADGVVIVSGLVPQTEYLFKLVAYYSDDLPLESNSVMGTTKKYVSAECDILKTWVPYDAKIDNENNAITGAWVMNEESTITLDVTVSENAEWYVYATADDARFSINEIVDKTVSLQNEGAENYAYIKVVAEDGIHSKTYKISIYRQSKSQMPELSVTSRFVTAGTTIELSAVGEIIKYTTDNSDPSEFNGIVYTEPIEITEDTILKVAAKESTKDEYSDVLTHKYYIVDVVPVIELDKPQNLCWENETIAVWDKAENAKNYTVQLYKNNEKYGEAVTVTENKFDFADYITVSGEYSFTVRAMGDNVYFSDSEESDMSEVFDFTETKKDTIVISDSEVELNNIVSECVALTAVYDKDGCLLKVELRNIDKDTIIEFSELNFDLTSAYEMRVFLLEALKSLKPITKSVQKIF